MRALRLSFVALSLLAGCYWLISYERPVFSCGDNVEFDERYPVSERRLFNVLLFNIMIYELWLCVSIIDCVDNDLFVFESNQWNYCLFTIFDLIKNVCHVYLMHLYATNI